MLDRQPYHGLSRKLVLAFDVGTTFSGVSFCILDPGEIPKIQGVSRYPAQEHVGGDSKIPSILYYDKSRKARAIGAEALQEHIIEQAEDQGWTKVEWWKMHLRPKHLASAHIKDDDIPPLPHGVSAIQILTDFMAYLFRCAKAYIEESVANGASVLASVAGSIDFVLSHPNGWEGPQQTQIRRAAVLAGLIPDTPKGQKRVTLVTEGEASLHYCVSSVLASDAWSKMPIEKSQYDSQVSDADEATKGGVIIVDAGGGTIDLSAYSMNPGTTAGKALSFEEIAPTECRLQGSVFVTRRANALLKEKLKGSRFADREIIDQMTDVFDKTTKHRFRGFDEPCYVKFGTMRDKDPQYDIRSGQLKLQGKDVAELFNPSLQAIVNAIQQQRQASSRVISLVFLVGGFAANDYLFKQLQTSLVPTGVSLSRPDGHVNKAVAEGAVSFYIDRLVSSRSARFTYGVEVSVDYNKKDREHRMRKHKSYLDPSGTRVIAHGFNPILKKGTLVSETQEFRRSYNQTSAVRSELFEADATLKAYRGARADPRWTNEEQHAFSHLCTVRADTSAVSPARHRERGRLYYTIAYDVVLLFGLTELQAQIRWTEKGVVKRSPATIIYDEHMEEWR